MLLNSIIRNSFFSKQIRFSCVFLGFFPFFGFWMLHELQICCMNYKWEWKISRSFNAVLNSIKGGSVVKNLPAKAGDTVSITRWGRSPGEGNGNTLQYSCWGNPLDRGTLSVPRESDMTHQLNSSTFCQSHCTLTKATMYSLVTPNVTFSNSSNTTSII